MYFNVAEKDNHHLEIYIPDENFEILGNFNWAPAVEVLIRKFRWT